MKTCANTSDKKTNNEGKLKSLRVPLRAENTFKRENMGRTSMFRLFLPHQSYPMTLTIAGDVKPEKSVLKFILIRLSIQRNQSYPMTLTIAGDVKPEKPVLKFISIRPSIQRRIRLKGSI